MERLAAVQARDHRACASGGVSVALCARARVLLDAAAIDPAISIRLRRMLSEPLVAPERPPADELRACLRALLVLDTLSPSVAEGVVALLDGGAL